MPHKHKRKRGEDESHYELPPTSRARPLSTSKGILFSDAAPQRKGAKRKRSTKDDDTPAAFKRLMAFKNGKKPRSGLDNGLPNPKTKGSGKLTEATMFNLDAKSAGVTPTIRPGERMTDFSSRVDAALPMIGLAKRNRGEKDAAGLRRPRNKAQKRQQNMQKEWREIDARWKAKVAEAKEEADEEYHGIWRSFDAQSGKKGKRRGNVRGLDEDEGDLWAAVGKSNHSTKRIGLHDVVQDVPRFTVVPKEKMKIRNGTAVGVDNVPQAAGSLKRREELSNSRSEVIAAYRNLPKNRTEASINYNDGP